MLVADVMMGEVHTCSVDDTAHDALAQMWRADVGALPIVDSAWRVVGMVTDRDLAMAGLLRGAPPHLIPVIDVTTKQVWSVGPGDTLAQAEKVMAQHQVRRLPVLDGAQLVGILTLTDLVRARTGVSPTDVTRTLAAIMTPRPQPKPTSEEAPVAPPTG